MQAYEEIKLRFTGEYSLAASVRLAACASFVESPHGRRGGEVAALDLTFALEGSWHPVGVQVVEQEGGLRARLFADPGGAAATNDVRAQIERILSLDIDGAGFEAVAARDHVVAGLRRECPGLRPILFPSPYEAAARAIIGHRLPAKQAAAVSARVAAEHGVGVWFDDRIKHAFPGPARLAVLPSIRGLSERKVEQLRALGTAAADGRFSTARLRAMKREAALCHLQQLPGIGPFSAELILLRGAGDADAFPRTEKRLHRAMAAAYNLGDEPAIETLERVSEQWRPYRSWVGLLLRNS